MIKIFLSKERVTNDITCDKMFFGIDSYFTRKFDFSVFKCAEISVFFPVHNHPGMEHLVKEHRFFLKKFFKIVKTPQHS